MFISSGLKGVVFSSVTSDSIVGNTEEKAAPYLKVEI
jgi:hypothetical protein